MTSDRTPLTDAQLAAALVELPGWKGDPTRIRRTVTGPAEQLPDLLDHVAAAETELDHHAVATPEADRVTFELWTHTEGGVTPLDLELARRIDDAALRLGFS